MRIGYLGPKGSFSHQAATTIKGGQPIAFPSFELIRALREGSVEKVVLPIENSIEGSVTWVLDLFFGNHFPFFIEGEIVLPIEHCLIGFGKVGDVKTVLSHPQALAQCRKFLNKLGVETKDADSTSEAVQIIAEIKDVKLAAIGSKMSANLYGAPVIQERVGGNNNHTRFIILGRNHRRRTGQDKTSLAFGTKNKPGALFRVLETFNALHINMTMITSRPSKSKLGEYVFFVDVESHQKDEILRVALRTIAKKVSFLRVLGSYPIADSKI